VVARLGPARPRRHPGAVTQAIAAVGPGWRWSGGPVRLEGFLQAGIRRHRAGDHRARWDWMVLAPIDLSLRVAGPIRLHAVTTAGLAGRDHTYYELDEFDTAMLRSWSLGARQLGVELGLSVEF
jgi:hypothetical protein